MNKYHLKIEYDGSNFVGWQYQKNGLSVQEILQKALNNNSGHLESNFLLGILQAKKKDFNKAKDFFIKTIQIDSSYIDAHYNLGIVFNELKDFQNSIN